MSRPTAEQIRTAALNQQRPPRTPAAKARDALRQARMMPAYLAAYAKLAGRMQRDE